MSRHYANKGAAFVPTYDDRTEQSHLPSTDINRLLDRAQRTGAVNHLERFGGEYADFSDFDFHASMNTIARMQEIFDAAPSEVRNEFNQDPQQFFQYVSDPANANELAQRLPDLARPGRQRPAVVRNAQTVGTATVQNDTQNTPATPSPEKAAPKPEPEN